MNVEILSDMRYRQDEYFDCSHDCYLNERLGTTTKNSSTF